MPPVDAAVENGNMDGCRVRVFTVKPANRAEAPRRLMSGSAAESQRSGTGFDQIPTAFEARSLLHQGGLQLLLLDFDELKTRQ